jgi:hypothetical protein
MTMIELLGGMLMAFLMFGALGALPTIFRFVRRDLAAREAALVERHVVHMRGPVRR